MHKNHSLSVANKTSDVLLIRSSDVKFLRNLLLTLQLLFASKRFCHLAQPEVLHVELNRYKFGHLWTL